ncbi:hypothetical protein V6x_60030 [Gimesia chilikensis]|uniref:Uncharacterized protein n=1 Tax=Gimesia chilikensis TaxID=2605989 RepID=A0A517WLV9_9PLAN|nr:hypothetical protein V6x_60030 [Gimesia chilikensis]
MGLLLFLRAAGEMFRGVIHQSKLCHTIDGCISDCGYYYEMIIN